ncbi:MAG: hypothetical protein R6U66_02590 [Bacteroidales bacterium]
MHKSGQSKKAFTIRTERLVESQIFLEIAEVDLGTPDKVIQDIERSYKFPVFLKKYLQLNPKIIGLNVDPQSKYALKEIMLLDSRDVPEAFIKTLSKELKDVLILERFQMSEMKNLLNKTEDKQANYFALSE